MTTSSPLLSTVEIDPTAAPARAAVIWMHGLGADAHDFEPIVPELGLDPALAVRFIFPNAPRQPVTINQGMVMPAWYDILTLDIPRREDAEGLRASQRAIERLMAREQERGIAAEKILLAGFSQGGAMALHTGLRYPQRLAGIVALSCYLPLRNSVDEERHPSNADVPIFIAHGSYDPVIPVSYGKASHHQLEALGYKPEWHEYPMEHSVVLEEIKAIGAFLNRVLA